MQINTVKTDGFSMDYIKFGSGKRALVIIPGLSVQSVIGSAEAIERAYGVFGDDFTVYLFDRRKEIYDGYTIRQMAQDTAAAIRSLGLDQVSLFGASQGGMIAMQMAILYPEIVNKLIVASSAARVGEDEYKTVARWIALSDAGDAEALYLDFGEALYPKTIFDSSRELLIAAAATASQNELCRFSVLARSIRGFDVTGELCKITCPMLALGDSDDRVLGAGAMEKIGDEMKNVPGFEMYIYSGYGHAVYDTAPDFKERMLAFLKK
ncbi:MAG: alpha/beta hydrolase [Clostridia bacterium]|nr:alpha/beta hydrolase [Clostridia bacterium]